MNLFIFTYLLYLWYLKASFSQIFINPLQVYSYFGTSLWQNGDYNLHDTPSNLLTAFQTQYNTFELAIQGALLDPTDSTVIARPDDDLDEFTVMVGEVSCQIICKMLTFRRLFRTPTFLKKLSYQLFSPILAWCRWTYIYSMNKHSMNLITGIWQLFKQSILVIVANQQYTLTPTFYDGPMLIIVHLGLPDSYMLGNKQLAMHYWNMA